MLKAASGKLSCKSDATVRASYIIQGNALKPGKNTLDFFYIVSLILTLFCYFIFPSIAWSFVLLRNKLFDHLQQRTIYQYQSHSQY